MTQFSNFNGRGQAQQVKYPDGTIRTYTYDVRGRILTDSYAGMTTTYTFDANGNKASVRCSQHVTMNELDSIAMPALVD